MTATEVMITVVVVVILALIAVAGWYMARRWSLRQRFGPEYDRLVAERDSRTDAEKELRERARRHGELELRQLSEEDKAGYATQWEQIQARFVDEPNAAVADAESLVQDVVSTRGYPVTDHDDYFFAGKCFQPRRECFDAHRADHEDQILLARGFKAHDQFTL